MTSPRDPDQLIRSFLADGPTEFADRSYDAVRADIERTRQRVIFGPWREPRMNAIMKVAIAIAAVVIVGVVGISLLPKSGGVGGNPAPTPTTSPSPQPTPSPTASLSPSPSAPTAFPRGGTLAIGRHSMILNDVPLSIAVSTSGWTSNGSWGIDKGEITPTGASFFMWPDGVPQGVYSDACGHVEAPPAGSSIAELANAVATMPGLDLVSGPADVTIDGRAAKLVVVTVPEDAACSPNDFWLWYRSDNYRWATALGQTVRVWIIDADGTTLWIDGDTYKGAPPEVGAEVEEMVNSIKFE